MDDSEIIRLFLERSEQAPFELAKKYGAACFYTAKSVLFSREDAEECVNDALMRVWESIPPAEPEFLGAYVLRITRNIAINRAEYNSAEKRGAFTLCLEELSECVPGCESAEGRAVLNELSGWISEFLRGLPREERQIFIRRYWYFDTAAQIAQLFGLRENTVRARLSRSRKKLKNFLISKEEI